MAPVKPMGIQTPPKGSKPGVTGFPQDYNDTPSPSQDLNPDVVTDPDALPEPRTARAARTTAPAKPKAKRGRRT
jgi:hypothetical protein